MRCFLPLLLIAFLPLSAVATTAKPENVEDPRATTAALLQHHPDLEYRVYGVEAYRKRDFPRALTLFRRAARFGDKPSQAMIAEMYERGEGVPADMALAYAWMDLAAERGYKGFTIRRERYWDRMDEATRSRAIAEGEAVYAEYGDAVAKPRFALQLRRASREGVGSRLGTSAHAQVTIPGPDGEQTIDGATFRRIGMWDAEKYWAWQDRAWRDAGPPKGRGGELQDVRTRPAGKP